MPTRILFWAPRLLSIALILFLAAFSLDEPGNLLHFLPSISLTIVLLIAWRHDAFGAAAFTAAAMTYIVWLATKASAIPIAIRANWALVIAGPALLIAALYFLNYRKSAQTPHSRLPAPTPN